MPIRCRDSPNETSLTNLSDETFSDETFSDETSMTNLSDEPLRAQVYRLLCSLRDAVTEANAQLPSVIVQFVSHGLRVLLRPTHPQVTTDGPTDGHPDSNGH